MRSEKKSSLIFSYARDTEYFGFNRDSLKRCKIACGSCGTYYKNFNKHNMNSYSTLTHLAIHIL